MEHRHVGSGELETSPVRERLTCKKAFLAPWQLTVGCAVARSQAKHKLFLTGCWANGKLLRADHFFAHPLLPLHRWT